MNMNLDVLFEKRQLKRGSRQRAEPARFRKSDFYQRVIGFTCLHCRNEVISDSDVSGVLNRNHCPYCLWSRHVDLWQAGDRLCACKMKMEPVGLTFKKRKNKYGSQLGELMIIHRCIGCAEYSINRIAADDDAQMLIRLMRDSAHRLTEETARLIESGIEPVSEADFAVVYRRLGMQS